MGYQPIENYGIIGDLETVALVGMDGSIDFLSFPRFDSPTIFAALLDCEKGGRFRVAPVFESCRQKQLYLPDTNILISRFLSAAGVAEVIDFMPIGPQPTSPAIVRHVRTVRGEIRYRMICDPRFDYGRARHRVDGTPSEVVFASEGADQTAIRLRSTAPLRIHEGAAHSEFTLRSGEGIDFVLEDARGESRTPLEDGESRLRAFERTADFWRGWVGRSSYRGRWREMVNRSALVLKLMTSRRHGSLIAGATFGLPEEVGGVRNWDYRYCWIRDAAFTVYALIRLGYTDEAGAFMGWIEQRCTELEFDGSLQIMYGLDGRHDLGEEILDHLEGYRGSRPVRVGNAAYNQLQLDIYGELMDSVYLYDKYGDPISWDFWRNLTRIVDWVCKNWQHADEGIWEVRGGRREFLHSRLMCWVAVDRAIRLARKRSLPAPLDHWLGERDTIYNDIQTRFWNPERRAFVQSAGASTLDASCLLMPLLRYTGPKDPRWLSTLQAVEHELVDDSLVYRYRLDVEGWDGLSGREGTFSMCSFWYVECLARAGDLTRARYFFEKMLGFANHLGLFAEQLGPAGEHLGNFPQAFTHLALISSAFALDRSLGEAGWRA